MMHRAKGVRCVDVTLRAARVNAGLTQQQVLENTGFARSTLTRWENGVSIPKAKDLEVLCKLYGIPSTNIKWK